MLDITLAYRSEVGDRTRNEDALRVARIGTMGHMVLSDGAGGHLGGTEASRRVVDIVDEALADQSQRGQPPDPDCLSESIKSAHWHLQGLQRSRDASQQMHATVVALWLDCASQQAVWAHVGDTRLYLLRAGQVIHVTSDDSVVQNMVEAGWLSPAQARAHPHKNQLLAALGMAEAIEPHVAVGALQDGDVFLLCTDGWWDPLGDDILLGSLKTSGHPSDWLDQLLRYISAQQPSKQHDNHSAIAVWVTSCADPVQTDFPATVSLGSM